MLFPPLRAILGLLFVYWYWSSVVGVVRSSGNFFLNIAIVIAALLLHVKIMRFINQWDKGGRYWRRY
jgi:hypothetical protein